MPEYSDAFTLLDAIVATVPIGLGVLDANLRYIRVNQALAEIDGAPMAAYHGRTPGEVLPRLASDLEPLLRQVVTSGEALRDVALSIPASPSAAAPRDLLASYYPLRTGGGPLRGVGVVIVDITERTRAEATLQALRASEANLHAIFASTAQAYLLLDANLHIVQWNRLADTGVVDHIGRHLVAGDPISEYMHSAQVPIRMDLMQRTLAGEHIHTETNLGSQSTPLWVAIEYAPVRESDGQVRGVCIGLINVTSRHVAEDALRASEARFRLLAEQAQDLIYRYRLAPEPGFEYVSPAATTITGYTPEDHYADPQLGFKLVVPEDRHLLAQAADGIASAPLTLRWQRKDGSIIWTEQVNRIFCDEHGLPIVIEGIARDITRRKIAEEQVRIALAAEQQARNRAELAAIQVSRLQTITAALAATLTVEDVALVVQNLGCQATGATTSELALRVTSGDQLRVVSRCQPAEAPDASDMIALDAALPAAYAARSQSSVWIESQAAAEAQFAGFSALLTHRQLSAYAALPLSTAGGALGVLALGFDRAQAFESDERTLLVAIAQQCAQALDRARLYGEVQATRTRLHYLSQCLLETQEQERRHIARELHDEVGQALGALKINLHLIGTPAGAGSLRLAESLELVDLLIQQVRALSLDLRPAVLDDLGLAAALTWYCERIQQRTCLVVAFADHLGDAPVPPLIATTCFRIAQEALTNVVRHANASQVSVRLNRQQGMLALSVCDDGIGFHVEEERAHAMAGASLGLISMSERAELAGGWIDISSAPGDGTEIWAWLPLVQ